ncbi:hypothetical protein DY023_08310 [Microbacterium bovistercoris]|uniref:Uncharacterized protein n=1 Tax=Microbacterium bovistercoris TaxID=2293570 RepID=A0A371NVU9_9MICO|nr:hypothetical protein [Microbacterium bovistercoris]REJ05930.1 hypothetical protein DY023_08310 [Microbacterium bovistercoris]
MTASRTASAPAPARPHRHEHGWITESRHPTSEGVIVYVRCAECGIRRVDLIPLCGLSQAAASRPAPSPPTA